MSIKLLLIGLVALAGGAFFLIRWRLAVPVVMVLLVYEGALRKWVLPGAQAQIFILKDFILLAGYAGFLLFYSRERIQYPIAKPLKIFMFGCVAYFAILILNPSSPSILLSVLGFKNYVFYFPIVFLVPYLISENRVLVSNLRAYMILILPAILISYVQFLLPPSHWMNSYVSQSVESISITSQFGGDFFLARTAGTFSYLSGNVTFLTAMFILSLSLLVSTGFALRRNGIVFIVFATSMGAMFTTGSRFGILSILMAVPFVLAVAVKRGFLSLDVFLKSCAGLLAVFGAVSLFAPRAVEAFLGRASRVSDTSTRFLSPFTETVMGFNGSGLIGTGLASTHGGLVPLILGHDTSWAWLNNTYLEVETGRVMLETGLVGFILFYGMRIASVLLALKLAMSFKSRFYSSLAAGVAYWASIHLVLYIASNPPAALYYYFSLGLLITVWLIENKRI